MEEKNNTKRTVTKEEAVKTKIMDMQMDAGMDSGWQLKIQVAPD